MKITKYVHSCLLVETADRVALFDPGEFSHAAGLLNISELARLDDIIITHEHADHFHAPFVEELLAKFPEAQITAPPLVATELEKEGITGVKTESRRGIEINEVTHESMAPLAPPPNPNFVVHYLDKLTQPGDSHHFEASKEILALPVTAPWGTWRRAAELGVALKPKTIIPIHDWHLNDQARTGLYDRLEAFFKQHDIEFIKLVDGQPVDL